MAGQLTQLIRKLLRSLYRFVRPNTPNREMREYEDYLSALARITGNYDICPGRGLLMEDLGITRERRADESAHRRVSRR